MSRAPMTQGDVYPVLTATLANNGEVVDLSGAFAVKFTMKTPAGVVIVNEQDATLLDALNGQVQYAWAPADTATPGRFYCEFEVTFQNGTMTFPNQGHDIVEIQPQLA